MGWHSWRDEGGVVHTMDDNEYRNYNRAISVAAASFTFVFLIAACLYSIASWLYFTNTGIKFCVYECAPGSHVSYGRIAAILSVSFSIVFVFYFFRVLAYSVGVLLAVLCAWTILLWVLDMANPVPLKPFVNKWIEFTFKNDSTEARLVPTAPDEEMLNVIAPVANRSSASNDTSAKKISPELPNSLNETLEKMFEEASPDNPNSESRSLPDEFITMFVDRIRGCWVIPPGGRESGYKIRMELSLNPDGSLKKSPKLLNAKKNSRFANLAESAIAAVTHCQNYDFLPIDLYDEWKTLTLSFDPNMFGN